MASSDDHVTAYIGPVQLPDGTGYLTVAQREEILQQYGVTAVVRNRPQWGIRCLSLSGPVGNLLAARRRCMELLHVEDLQDAAASKHGAGGPDLMVKQRSATDDAKPFSKHPPPKSAKSAGKGNSPAPTQPQVDPYNGWTWWPGYVQPWWTFWPPPAPAAPAADEESSANWSDARSRRYPARATNQGTTSKAKAVPKTPPATENDDNMEEVEVEPESSESSESLSSPRAIPGPSAKDPHTPPGFERVKDSEKCAARVQPIKRKEGMPPSADRAEAKTTASGSAYVAGAEAAAAAEENRPATDTAAAEHPVIKAEEKEEPTEPKTEVKEIKEEPTEPSGASGSTSAKACLAVSPLPRMLHRVKKESAAASAAKGSILSPPVPDTPMIPTEDFEEIEEEELIPGPWTLSPHEIMVPTSPADEPIDEPPVESGPGVVGGASSDDVSPEKDD